MCSKIVWKFSNFTVKNGYLLLFNRIQWVAFKLIQYLSLLISMYLQFYFFSTRLSCHPSPLISWKVLKCFTPQDFHKFWCISSSIPTLLFQSSYLSILEPVLMFRFVSSLIFLFKIFLNSTLWILSFYDVCTWLLCYSLYTLGLFNWIL